MPRYYFHFKPNGPVDDCGDDLPDDAAARAMAAAVVRELALQEMRSDRLVVLNEAGEIVHQRRLIT